jgi:hypothetical protein
MAKKIESMVREMLNLHSSKPAGPLEEIYVCQTLASTILVEPLRVREKRRVAGGGYLPRSRTSELAYALDQAGLAQSAW